jgi:PAS domain S-box-containing protein
VFSRLNITTKGLLLVFVPVILEIIMASYLALMVSDSFTKLIQVQHSADALSDLTNYRSKIWIAICKVLNPNETNVEKRLRALDEVDARTTPALMPDTRVYPELTQFRDDVQSLHVHLHAILSKHREKLANSPQSAFKTDISMQELMPMVLEAQTIADNAFYIEKIIGAVQPQEMAKFQTQFYCWLVAVLVSSYLICFLLIRAFSNDIVRRLNNIECNARKISYGQPLAPVQEGCDEIADLDQRVYTAGQELEELRMRESAILDNATDVLCSADINLKLLDIGKAATRNWGYDLDALAGRSILSLLSEDSVDSTREEFTAIATEKKEGQIENTVKCADGSLKTFLWKVNWLQSDQIFYCVAHDVTQIRALEKLKQDFLAMVSHDLRTPLNSVSIGLSMLAENRLGDLPAGVQSQLTRSRKSMERLSHLVHDLLELEKFGSGKIELNKETASASEICGYAKESMEVLAERGKVKLVGPVNDVAVLVDVKRITQVLINILSNAIKFSAENSSVVMDIKEVGDFAEIGVKDSGPGIALEHQAKIFNRFEQAGIAAKSSMKSTGLGLAIAQVIVIEHGGDIGVESEPGKGCRFWIRVPKLIDLSEDIDEEGAL